jgi:hypothetical protein
VRDGDGFWGERMEVGVVLVLLKCGWSCVQNLQLNLTLWRLGTLPPALIAFDGNVQPISEKWHMLGLGYNTKTNLEGVKRAAVVHYNGQAKPWLDIAFPELRRYWSKYVNYSNEFVRQCNILERA